MILNLYQETRLRLPSRPSLLVLDWVQESSYMHLSRILLAIHFNTLPAHAFGDQKGFQPCLPDVVRIPVSGNC